MRILAVVFGCMVSVWAAEGPPPKVQHPARVTKAKVAPLKQLVRRRRLEALRPAARNRAVRSPAPIGIAAPPLGSARQRHTNPAVIGGSPMLGKRSTGAIDGKQVPRRP